MDYMSYIRAIRSSDLSGIQKITAIMIASHYDFTKGDPAYPTNKTLAKETGFGISSIVKAKRVLCDRGYLCSEMRWDNSCMYTPMLPDITEGSTTYSLNTHINTHTNTKINTKINNNVSDETLVINILTPEAKEELLSW
jgi:hypothetical protein